MTARLLPSHRAVSRLEAAAYDVIDDVLDVLQQVESRDATAEDVDEAHKSLNAHLTAFRVLAAFCACSLAADQKQIADWLAALAWAGA